MSTRIRSNIQSLNVLQALRQVNNRVALHQLRLAISFDSCHTYYFSAFYLKRKIFASFASLR